MPIRVFPIANVPGVHFSNDFGNPRGNEGERGHAGTDVFAPEGTPILAVDDGTIRYANEALGGLSFYLKANDGTTYFGTHMSGVEGGPRAVKAGEVIGYVGHGGNAAGTPDHLHFQIGSGTVNPFPLLQRAERRTTPSTFPWLLALGLAGGLGYLYVREYGNPIPDLSRGLARLTR